MHFWHYLVNRAEAGAPGYEAMLVMLFTNPEKPLQGTVMSHALSAIETLAGSVCGVKSTSPGRLVGQTHDANLLLMRQMPAELLLLKSAEECAQM